MLHKNILESFCMFLLILQTFKCYLYNELIIKFVLRIDYSMQWYNKVVLTD